MEFGAVGMAQTPTQSQLYEQDFALWIDDTVAKLKAHQFDQIDLENLIEEVESLGRRDKRELRSWLRVLLSHLLKRCYVNLPNNFRGWEVPIREQRSELQDLLEQSPSLKSYLWQEFDELWQTVLFEVREDYPIAGFPDRCPFPQDTNALLSERFWQSDK